MYEAQICNYYGHGFRFLSPFHFVSFLDLLLKQTVTHTACDGNDYYRFGLYVVSSVVRTFQIRVHADSHPCRCAQSNSQGTGDGLRV